MKKSVLIVLFAAAFSISFAQEYKVVTIVESIVPGGTGRSRIVENQGSANIDALTTQREGIKAAKDQPDRGEVKESGENFKETMLVNFYSMVGINFGNIASNDAVITAKINQLVKQGWQVAFVTSGVEAHAGKDDKAGLFITRIFFKK